MKMKLKQTTYIIINKKKIKKMQNETKNDDN